MLHFATGGVPLRLTMRRFAPCAPRRTAFRHPCLPPPSWLPRIARKTSADTKPFKLEPASGSATCTPRKDRVARLHRSGGFVAGGTDRASRPPQEPRTPAGHFLHKLLINNRFYIYVYRTPWHSRRNRRHERSAANDPIALKLGQSSPSTVGTARGARGNPGRPPRRSRRDRQTASNEVFSGKTLVLIKGAKRLRSG